MVAEGNKVVAQRLYKEVINEGNLAVVDEIVAEEYVNHNEAPGQAPGREGLKQIITLFRTAFPDLDVTIERMLAEGDQVMVHETIQGTHKGEFFSIAPTGKQVTAPVMNVYRVADGKIAERWGIVDELSILQQLGVVYQELTAG